MYTYEMPHQTHASQQQQQALIPNFRGWLWILNKIVKVVENLT